jgi:hypothetical protein
MADCTCDNVLIDGGRLHFQSPLGAYPGGGYALFRTSGGALQLHGGVNGTYVNNVANNDVLLQIHDPGQVVVGPNAPVRRFSVDRNVPGSEVGMSVRNGDGTNASSRAVLLIEVSGPAVGDPFQVFHIPGGTSWGVGVDNDNDDLFQIGDSANVPGTSPRLVIHTNGNVGIGTLERDDVTRLAIGGGGLRFVSPTPGATPAGYALYRAQDAQGQGWLQFQSGPLGYEFRDQTNARSYLAIRGSGTVEFPSNVTGPAVGGCAIYRAGQGGSEYALQLQGGSVGYTFQSMTNAPLLRILNDGRVAMGPGSPIGHLDVQGAAGQTETINMLSGGVGGIALKNLGNAPSWRIFADTANSQMRIKSAGSLALHSGNANVDGANERLTITADGNVGIGETNPQAKLQITGSTAPNATALEVSGPPSGQGSTAKIKGDLLVEGVIFTTGNITGDKVYGAVYG